MSEVMTNDTHAQAMRYAELGWSLVGIPAGSKAPQTFGWQQRATPPSFWKQNPTHNIGILHSLSGTCALDIDNMDNTRLICREMNIDLDAILNGAPRIVGRPDRGKVLFRAPEGITLTTRKISWPVENDPRKTEVVFELRAGSVQDVLPPSIHPDTGTPYRWAGPSIESGLPEIPEQLLAIWRDWDRFRRQLVDICPWKKTPEFTPPPKKPRKVGDKGDSIIAAYNNAVPITEALEAAGYRQFGKRWLSPNSTTGLPGVVVFDDGRAYSHHASDPFDLEHSFDAFEVFCQYQHMGNAKTAAKAAAEILEIAQLPEGPSEEDREMSQHGAKVWETIREKPKNDGIPPHLLTVPGVLGELVEYSARTAIKPQPQFDVQVALALGSVAMGRRFVTDNRNMSSLYFLNIGKTGSGKEHANTVIEDTLEAADMIHLRGPNGYTSAPGVISSLKDKPTHVAVIDEFGSMLSSASARGNQHKKDALVMMMEAFGRQTKTLRNVGYATLQMTEGQKKALDVEIKSPSLTVVGMTTPETFYEAIGGKDVASGFLNRFLIVESRRPRELSRTPEMIDPPRNVIDWVKESASATAEAGNLSGDNGHDFPPTPILIPFTKQARRLLRDYEQKLNDWQDNLPSVQADMLNRAREIAMRLSLIVAHSLGDKEIGEEATQWAIDYVDFYAQQTLETMSLNLAEGDTDALRKKVADSIMNAGPSGLTMRELIDANPKLGNLKKHERDGLLDMVRSDYAIEQVVSENKGKRGRPPIIHRKIQDA